MRWYKSERYSGLLTPRPLLYELSMLVGLMNGYLDRDNMPTGAFGSGDIVAGAANRFSTTIPTTSGTTFFPCRTGIYAIDGVAMGNTDYSAAITTGDSSLVIYASYTLRAETVSNLQTITLGLGILVDGQVVAHSGCQTFIVTTDDEVYLPFAFRVAVPVGPGPHVVMPFVEVVAATVGTEAAGIGIYKGVTIVREAHR